MTANECIKTLNRTNVELKFLVHPNLYENLLTLNRTNVELKYDMQVVTGNAASLLIAPMWN